TLGRLDLDGRLLSVLGARVHHLVLVGRICCALGRAAGVRLGRFLRGPLGGLDLGHALRFIAHLARRRLARAAQHAQEQQPAFHGAAPPLSKPSTSTKRTAVPLVSPCRRLKPALTSTTYCDSPGTAREVVVSG